MTKIAGILKAAERGDPTAAEELLPLVYNELRRLASARLADDPAGHTLQPTALVHEAWLRLAGGKDQSWDGRPHFFAAAAEAMRRVLIDRARQKHAAKRGGGWQRVELEVIDAPTKADEDTLVRVSEALEVLGQQDPKAAEFVKLRFFAGLSVEDAALAMGVTDRTGRRYWRFARAWLYARLGREEG